MRISLTPDTLLFLEEETADLIKEIFKSAGFFDVSFDEVAIKSDEIRLYIGEFYLKIYQQDKKWQVWVFDRQTHEEAVIDVNTRALIELLENKLNNE
jgi:hypothetical protein